MYLWIGWFCWKLVSSLTQLIIEYNYPVHGNDGHFGVVWWPSHRSNLAGPILIKTKWLDLFILMTITCVIIITISQIQLPGTIYTSTDAYIETLPLYCSIKASTHVKNSTIGKYGISKLLKKLGVCYIPSLKPVLISAVTV